MEIARIDLYCDEVRDVAARKQSPGREIQFQGDRTVKRSGSLLIAAACSALLTGLLSTSPSAFAGGNCQAKLSDNSYSCTFKSSNESPTTDCIEFTPASEGTSQNFNFFDAGVLSRTESFGCTCGTVGPFKSPRFDSSSDSFECVDEAGTQIHGKIKGKKFSGQGTDIDGNSLIYTCTLLDGRTCG